MQQYNIMSARDLRIKSGELMKNAEEGTLVLITKHGVPKLVGIPFDNTLLMHGVTKKLALDFVEKGIFSPIQGAKFANMDIRTFGN